MAVELISSKVVEGESTNFSVSIKPLKIEGAPRRQLNALSNHALSKDEGSLAFKSVHPNLVGISGVDRSQVESFAVAASQYLSNNFPAEIQGLGFTVISRETMQGIGIGNPPDFAIMASLDFNTDMPAINTVKEPFFGTFNQFLETLK